MVRGSYYPESDVDEQEEDFDALRLELRFRALISSSSDDEWIFEADVDRWDFDTDARFDESGLRLPSELGDYSFGATYRRLLEGGWIVGQSFRLGSASDDPFSTINEMYVRGTTFLRVPAQGRDSWMYFLYIDTSRPIPVTPGFGYHYIPSRDFQLIAGIPILLFRWNFTEDWSWFFTYLPVTINNVHTAVTWQVTDPMQISAGFRWDSKYYRREDREKWDDRIRVEEKRLYAAAEYAFSSEMSVQGEAGYAFGRQFGEGNSRDDYRDNEIEIDPGAFIRLAFNWRL
jgi:hypothetical protein